LQSWTLIGASFVLWVARSVGSSLRNRCAPTNRRFCASPERKPTQRTRWLISRPARVPTAAPVRFLAAYRGREPVPSVGSQRLLREYRLKL